MWHERKYVTKKFVELKEAHASRASRVADEEKAVSENTSTRVASPRGSIEKPGLKKAVTGLSTVSTLKNRGTGLPDGTTEMKKRGTDLSTMSMKKRGTGLSTSSATTKEARLMKKRVDSFKP